MNPFAESIALDRSSDIPVYLQIENALIHGIRRGQLRRGIRLPGTRELAAALTIHRKTLQTAYDELMAQGWITIVPRKGTYVAMELPEIRPVRIGSAEIPAGWPEKAGFRIDQKRIAMLPGSDLQIRGNLMLDDGLPDVRLAPIELLMREYRGIARRDAFRRYLRYGGPRGAPVLLETLSAFLNETRGLPISEQNLLITKGAQMGFYLAATLLLKPGDNVIVGEPGYLTATQTFRQAGAAITRVPVDESGIDVHVIEALCKKKQIRLVYVIPHHHYPTTVRLTPDRRLRLLELAARHRFAIIEDDYDYDFDYGGSPVLPMASLDHHGNVLYIGTLTKTLVPAVRVGFLAASRQFIDAASHLRRVVDWQGDTMMEVAIAQLYRNGTIASHIRKAVTLYRERRDHFCSLLTEKLGEAVLFNVPDGGLSVWTRFARIGVKQLAERASKKGLAMSDGSFHGSGNPDVQSARLGFASLTFEEQRRAIAIMAECL